MKILFLDHDGVICLPAQWGSRFSSMPQRMFDDLDKDAVSLLNDIIEKTNCNIVVSSDWRIYCELEEMKKVYKANGIIIGPMDYTPRRVRGSEKARAEEIKVWMDAHLSATDIWCAVDDMDMTKYLTNFVLTDANEGLTREKADEIIKILNQN